MLVYGFGQPGPVDDIIQRVMACRTLAGQPSDSSNLPSISVPGDEQILSHDGIGKTGRDQDSHGIAANGNTSRAFFSLRLGASNTGARRRTLYFDFLALLYRSVM